jgi:GNAT superfamily N-acetyltransferase
MLIDLVDPIPHVRLVVQLVGDHAATFDIEVEPAHRGQGLGSQALGDLIEWADELNLALDIYAEPDPEQQTLASLVAWYKGFGFHTVGKPKHGAQRMYRPTELH